jgi:hypothetical protein
MEFLILFGLVIVAMIGIQFTKEKEIMRIEFDKVAQFLAFMALMTFARIAWSSFQMDMGKGGGMGIPPEIASARWTMILVFWEDMAFGVPIYFAFKYLKKKWQAIAIAIVISILFGLGHAYEGKQAMAVLALVPYFGMYKYGKRVGFGTTMVCHILYDFITFYTAWLLPLLL